MVASFNAGQEELLVSVGVISSWKVTEKVVFWRTSHLLKPDLLVLCVLLFLTLVRCSGGFILL